MDKTFIGLNCSSLEKGIESEQITKVEILNNDGDIVGQAGTETGKTLSVTHPDGTNAMATYILSQISGYVQRGYSADRAIIDPAVELGDGVTVGGIYSVIANEAISFDALLTSDISAPDADEVDDEYPYQTYQQRVEKKVATVYSKITKTQNSISLIVDSTTGNVTAAKIIASINNDTSEVKISADKVDITGFVTFSDLETEGQTTINGANITTGTVLAAYLKFYASMNIFSNASATQAQGWMGYGTISTPTWSDDGVGMVSFGSLCLGSNYYAYIGGGTGYYTQVHKYLAGDSSFRPSADASYSCGANGSRWSYIWASSGTIQTSDRNKKKEINYDANMDGFFDKLKPCSYKFIDGTSGRKHYGLIAQDVEDAMTAEGMTGKDFAGFCKDVKSTLELVADENGKEHYQDIIHDGEYDYSLRYDEFIGLCIDQIQKLKARVNALEGN